MPSHILLMTDIDTKDHTMRSVKLITIYITHYTYNNLHFVFCKNSVLHRSFDDRSARKDFSRLMYASKQNDKTYFTKVWISIRIHDVQVYHRFVMTTFNCTLNILILWRCKSEKFTDFYTR